VLAQLLRKHISFVLCEQCSAASKAIALDPMRAVAYLNLGAACAKLQRGGEAKQAYEKYL
jgi:Flp pilus assembly protein TadD